jgi:eukaryotic-like serine/threonine-protein kinase
MGCPGRMNVVGPFPGGEATGELLGLMVTATGEPQPLRLVPVPERIAGDPAALETLRRVAAAAAELQHPNILPTFGIEEVQGKAMRVVAWTEAHPLRVIVQVGDRLPPQIAARILVDACRAAQHAHDRGGESGRVAGDLSLDSVLVAANGVTLVAGLGEPVTPLPGDTSAEPALVTNGASVPTPEDDVRSLGTMLHALLSGEQSPGAKTGSGVASPAEPPALAALGIAGPLAEIATRSLSREPAERYPSPGVLADEIASVSGELVQPLAVATYVDLLFPPDEEGRADRRKAIEAALAQCHPATGEPVAPEPATERSAPAAAIETAPPSSDATLSQAKGPQGPPTPADPPSGGASAAAADLVSTADIVVDSPLPPAVPDMVSTADILIEPPAILPEPDLVSTADIVVEWPRPPPAPDLVSTADIVPEVMSPLPPRPPAVAGFCEEPATPPVAQPRFLPEARASQPFYRRPEALWAGVIVSCLALGFCLSYFLGVFVPSPRAPAAAAAARNGATASVELPAPPAAPVARPAAAAPAPAPVRAAPPPPAPGLRLPPGKAMLLVSAEPAGSVFIDGRLIGRSPLSRAVSRGQHKVRLQDAEQGFDVTRTVEVKGSEARVRFTIGTGRLTVTAPEGAAIFMDGRRVGTTEIRDLAVWEGEHRLVVTLGQARNDHAFQLRAGGNYLYEVARTVEP